MTSLASRAVSSPASGLSPEQLELHRDSLEG